MRRVPWMLLLLALAGCPDSSDSGSQRHTGLPDDGFRALGETCDPVLGATACATADLGCCPPMGCNGDAGCTVNTLCRELDGGGCPP
jgi:hypothetical protein